MAWASSGRKSAHAHRADPCLGNQVHVDETLITSEQILKIRRFEDARKPEQKKSPSGRPRNVAQLMFADELVHRVARNHVVLQFVRVGFLLASERNAHTLQHIAESRRLGLIARMHDKLRLGYVERSSDEQVVDRAERGRQNHDDDK